MTTPSERERLRRQNRALAQRYMPGFAKMLDDLRARQVSFRILKMEFPLHREDSQPPEDADSHQAGPSR